jgi:hypothetical protein
MGKTGRVNCVNLRCCLVTASSPAGGGGEVQGWPLRSGRRRLVMPCRSGDTAARDGGETTRSRLTLRSVATPLRSGCRVLVGRP